MAAHQRCTGCGEIIFKMTRDCIMVMPNEQLAEMDADLLPPDFDKDNLPEGKCPECAESEKTDSPFETIEKKRPSVIETALFYALILSSLITLATGCSETEHPVAVGPDVPDDEVILTAARLESMVDAEVFLKATESAKVYVSLRDEDPDAAYVALERAAFFLWWGHPLYEEWAQLEFRFDSAGKATLPEMVRKHEIELEMAKALSAYKEQVPEFESRFKKTKSHHDAIVAQGKDPAEVWIGYNVRFEED